MSTRATKFVLGGCLALVLLGGGGMIAGGGLVAAGAAGGLVWLTSSQDAPEPMVIEQDELVRVDELQPTERPLLDEEELDALVATDGSSEQEEPGGAEADTSRGPAGPSNSTGGEPAGTVAREGSAASARGAPAPTPVSTQTARVSVEGSADVVLVGDEGRHTVPGPVPPGRYRIEVTFPGEPALDVGPLTVGSGDTHTIRCNARMGICRASS